MLINALHFGARSMFTPTAAPSDSQVGLTPCRDLLKLSGEQPRGMRALINTCRYLSQSGLTPSDWEVSASSHKSFTIGTLDPAAVEQVTLKAERSAGGCIICGGWFTPLSPKADLSILIEP